MQETGWVVADLAGAYGVGKRGGQGWIGSWGWTTEDLENLLRDFDLKLNGEPLVTVAETV